MKFYWKFWIDEIRRYVSSNTFSRKQMKLWIEIKVEILN